MERTRGNLRGAAEIHVAVLLFGFAGLFGKWLSLPPAVIVLGRVLFASLALAFILWLKKGLRLVRKAGDIMLLAACGAVLGLHWFAFFRSIQVSTVAVGLLAYSTFPAFLFFLEPLFFKSRMEASAMFCVLLCLAGAYLIVPVFSLSDSVFRGFLWGLGSSLSFAALTMLNRGLTRRLPSLNVALLQDAFAALFLAPAAAAGMVRLSARDVILLAVLGVLCTALAHSLFIDGLKKVSALTAGIIATLEPVYGILLAWFLLGENPSLRTLAGGALILLSAAMTTRRETGPGTRTISS
jgi:drug/metabolite transporter (DMT)-like permease